MAHRLLLRYSRFVEDEERQHEKHRDNNDGRTFCWDIAGHRSGKRIRQGQVSCSAGPLAARRKMPHLVS
jgi:hypothetical protein